MLSYGYSGVESGTLKIKKSFNESVLLLFTVEMTSSIPEFVK